MKIPPPNRQNGAVAVIVMLATLSLLLVLANANSRGAIVLKQELNRLDLHQQAFWANNYFNPLNAKP